MNFVDDEHEFFFADNLISLHKLAKVDAYSASLIYTLGICEETRQNFKDIFDIEKGEININSLQAPWQTDSSARVTRMAFNLWNNCMYNSEQDIENNKVSSKYNPSEIFCCNYAPYFYEGIKIRYPEYSKISIKDKDNKDMER